MSYDIQISCGGKKIELNAFAEKIVGNTLLGLLSALRDVDIRNEVSIVLKPTSS